MPPLIRPYNDASDRAQMIALYRAAWHAAYDAVDGAGKIEQLIANLLDGDPPQMFALGPHDMALIAERNGQVHGGIRGHPRDGLLHLSGMYVRTDMKRHGVGRALLADLLQRYPAGTVVRADVRPTSIAALAFYEKQGFIRIGRTRTNAGGEHWVDTIEMQRTLK